MRLARQHSTLLYLPTDRTRSAGLSLAVPISFLLLLPRYIAGSPSPTECQLRRRVTRSPYRPSRGITQRPSRPALRARSRPSKRRRKNSSLNNNYSATCSCKERQRSRWRRSREEGEEEEEERSICEGLQRAQRAESPNSSSVRRVNALPPFAALALKRIR